MFAVLSFIVGTLLIIATPPLRGPDESQHFLRAYGVAQGDIFPAATDAQGRKGLFLPAAFAADFRFFDALSGVPVKNFRDVMAEHRRHKLEQSSRMQTDAVTFRPYAGSEGYSPLAYLPQSLAALLAQSAGLDFVGTIYLMRFLGLIALTTVFAYAIAMTPCLRWAFVAIAMLPAAIYGRSVINADGAALASTMVVTVLCLRAGFGLKDPPGRRAVWMAICALTKPPQLAFVLLEAMSRPLRGLPQHWRAMAIVVLPAVIAALVWSWLSSAEVAAWRLTELTGIPTKQFDPAWKLGFMLREPLHFPQAAFATLTDIGELWRQLIGVLGLFDTVLQLWAYPAISILVLATCITPMYLPAATRLRIASVAILTAAVYSIGIFLIFYLVWTPIDADKVWGVQGRYFLPVLPALAIAISATVNRGPGNLRKAAIAIATALLSGGAALESILRVEWN